MIKFYYSAFVMYYTPSDQSGIGGMHYDIINTTPSWHNSPACYDCVFLENGGAGEDKFRGLLVARVLSFSSFTYREEEHACTFVEWFLLVDKEPDEETSMWIVTPEFDSWVRRVQSVITLDTIICGAHLIGVYGDRLLCSDFHYSQSLDSFDTYYLNKFIGHHAHALALYY
ncbi:hypothetical protein ID866_9603 [Astraeus odoratus]|nr:hypothetical protein ID866_9603 [Astraeus odoratus]